MAEETVRSCCRIEQEEDECMRASTCHGSRSVHSARRPLPTQDLHLQVRNIAGDLEMSREEVLYFVTWLRSLPEEDRESMQASREAAEVRNQKTKVVHFEIGSMFHPRCRWLPSLQAALAERRELLREKEPDDAAEKLSYQGGRFLVP